MSRYTITVTRTASNETDPAAIIGYDRRRQTYFLQAFPDDDGEDLQLWLGFEDEEYETLSSLREAAIRYGYDFVPIVPETLNSLIDDHAELAMQENHETILQDLADEANK